MLDDTLDVSRLPRPTVVNCEKSDKSLECPDHESTCTALAEGGPWRCIPMDLGLDFGAGTCKPPNCSGAAVCTDLQALLLLLGTGSGCRLKGCCLGNAGMKVQSSGESESSHTFRITVRGF